MRDEGGNECSDRFQQRNIVQGEEDGGVPGGRKKEKNRKQEKGTKEYNKKTKKQSHLTKLKQPNTPKSRTH